MKTIICIIFILAGGYTIAQVPSINVKRMDYDFTKSKTKEVIWKDKSIDSDNLEILNKEAESILFLLESFSNINSETLGETDSTSVNDLKQFVDRLKTLTDLIKKIQIDKKNPPKESDIKTLTIAQEEKLINYYDQRGVIILNEIDSLISLIEKAENENELKRISKEIWKLKTEFSIILDKKKVDLKDNEPIFFPTLNADYRNYFFEKNYSDDSKTNYLNAFSLVSNGKTIAGQSELLADNLGVLRITAGTIISSTKTEAEEDDADSLSDSTDSNSAFERLLSGGGNLYLDATLPIWSNGNNWYDGLVFANTRFAGDIEGFGEDINTSTFNGQIGLNTYLSLTSENKHFNFFVLSSAGYFLGTNEFNQNLGIANDKGFFLGKIVVGVTLLSRFRLSATVLNFSNEEVLRKERITVGLQFLTGTKERDD